MRMKPNEAFCQLARTVALCPQRNTKLAWLGSWLETCPREDRGWGVAALVGDLDLGRVKAGVVRKLAAAAIDEELFAQSYDFVGDLAETTALIWPHPHGHNAPEPSLDTVVRSLQAATPDAAEEMIRGWMDGLDVSGRWGCSSSSPAGLGWCFRPHAAAGTGRDV